LAAVRLTTFQVAKLSLQHRVEMIRRNLLYKAWTDNRPYTYYEVYILWILTADKDRATSDRQTCLIVREDSP
jgi:hypothetical protein